jgi:hypothetical protein
LEGSANYFLKMASGGMIYIPIFIKIGSGVQNLSGVVFHIATHREESDRTNLLSFFENMESTLKRDRFSLMGISHRRIANLYLYTPPEN